jgi:hypothetical protein
LLSPRGRPSTFPIKKLVALDGELMAGIAAFRADAPSKTESDAIRTIIRDWLIAHGYLDNPPDREDAN